MNNNTNILKACYHLRLAMDYLEVTAIELKAEPKYLLKNKIKKIEVVLKDFKHNMSQESAEIFEKEVEKGDVLFFSQMGELLINLSQPERETIELIATAMVNGEQITFTDK